MYRYTTDILVLVYFFHLEPHDGLYCMDLYSAYMLCKYMQYRIYKILWLRLPIPKPKPL